MEYFNYILVLLSSAVIFIFLCNKLRLPPIVGYLLVGILVGPGGLRWLQSLEDLQPLAEFGIVFLMFSLGLEFSIPKMLAKKHSLGLGFMQVLFCLLAGLLVGLCCGLPFKMLFIASAALALSSTAVVVKQLSEQKEQAIEPGISAINILLFQDIFAIFLLLIIPALSAKSASNTQVYIDFLGIILRGVGVVIAFAIFGLWVLRPLFHKIARLRSTELFMLAVLLTSLSAAAITRYLGLSMALGAFLAGLMLGETEFRHQIESDIRAFRDVLLGLFFVVIGAYLELDKVVQNFFSILFVLFFILIVKAWIVYLVARIFLRNKKIESLRLAVILAHGSEFSFVILKEAIDNAVIPETCRAIIFPAVVISLLFAPLILRFSKQLALFILHKDYDTLAGVGLHNTALSEYAANIADHVIICGFGRVGQILARFLDHDEIPWLALDLDSMRVEKSSVAGESCFFGDASDHKILAAACLARSRMIVVTFSNDHLSLDVLKLVRSVRLDIPVFIRTLDDSNIDAFRRAGATAVVPESLEGSLMLASHLMIMLGLPTRHVISRIRKVHADHYEGLRGFYTGTDELRAIEESDSSRRSLHSVVIANESAFVGKQLADLMSDESAVVIKSLMREQHKFIDPELNMVLSSGDVLVILATPEEALIVEERSLIGIVKPIEEA
jgi:CPA2 family monovalent cation:H+ antiporter-2